ncbi:UNVERIFIED_CONTAM: hypothetical protein FKN15_043402 [Acipenser sinensis]
MKIGKDRTRPELFSEEQQKKFVREVQTLQAQELLVQLEDFSVLVLHVWQVSKPEDNPLKEGADAARASITFAFFSIFTWKAAQSVLAFQRYRIGADSALFSQDYTDPSQDASLPYSSYTGGDDLGSPPTAIPYQQPSNEAFEGTPGYQSQDY